MYLQFREDLSSREVETAVDRIGRAIRTKHPEIKNIFVEAEAIGGRVVGSVRRKIRMLA
jgi:hypothetical protein